MKNAVPKGKMQQIETLFEGKTLRTQEFSAQPDLSEELIQSLEKAVAVDMTLEALRPPWEAESVEAVLQKAQETFTDIWNEKVSPVIRDLFLFWADALGDTPAELYFKNELQKTDSLEKKIAAQYFSDLEELKEKIPLAWKTLVALSMFRQQQVLLLVQEWCKQLPASSFTSWGIEKSELLLALEMANTVGPFVDRTYLAQMELVLAGSDTLLKNPGSEEAGAEHVYEVFDSTTREYTKIPYKNMFPETWPQIAQKYREFSFKVSQEFPEKGALFAQYLLILANLYDSEETDFETLALLWKEVSVLQREILNSDWPINLCGSGDAYITGALNKADANFTIGLKTKKTQDKQEMYGKDYLPLASRILETYDPQGKHAIRPTFLNVLLCGMGNNTFWRNQGEAESELAICYTNSAHEVGTLTTFPTYQKIFYPEKNDDFSQEELSELLLLSTLLHELGHTFFPMDEEEVTQHVGYAEPHIEMIEELKADTNGIRVFWEKEKTNENRNRAKKLLELIVAYSLDYIQTAVEKPEKIASHKEMGSIIIRSLLESGSLVKTPDGYQIVTIEEGFQAIIAIADEILRYYSDPQTTPAKVQNYALQKIAENNESKLLREFLQEF